MPSDLPPPRVSANLRRVRADLLSGRGPGASDAEVAAHTRNRVMIAGETATRRLEMAARQTARARLDAATIADTIQLSRAELAHTVDQVERHMSPRHLLSRLSRMLHPRRRT